jgi:hypothetical protein
VVIVLKGGGFNMVREDNAFEELGDPSLADSSFGMAYRSYGEENSVFSYSEFIKYRVRSRDYFSTKQKVDYTPLSIKGIDSELIMDRFFPGRIERILGRHKDEVGGQTRYLEEKGIVGVSDEDIASFKEE